MIDTRKWIACAGKRPIWSGSGGAISVDPARAASVSDTSANSTAAVSVVSLMPGTALRSNSRDVIKPPAASTRDKATMRSETSSWTTVNQPWNRTSAAVAAAMPAQRTGSALNARTPL